MRLIALGLSVAMSGILVTASAARAGQPVGDPTRPVTLNPNKTYPLTADPPATLVTATGTGGVQTMIAGSTRRVVSIKHADGSGAFITIRDEPAGLVVGNAFDGWTMDQSQDSGGYWGGYTFGHFDGCGWIHTGHFSTPGTNSTQLCSPRASTPNTAWGWLWNGHSNCKLDPDTGLQTSCDGTPFTARCHPVPEFVNMHLNRAADPTDAVRYISNPGHAWGVNWRYITNDNAWVMARDPHITDGSYGSWVFIPRSCFTGTFPGAQLMTD